MMRGLWRQRHAQIGLRASLGTRIRENGVVTAEERSNSGSRAQVASRVIFSGDGRDVDIEDLIVR